VSPYGLFVATVDGRARRKVATLPSAPLAWSPDGRWIAGSDDAGDGAVVARVSDGKTRHLGDTNYLVPFIEGSAWSPDGRLAWSRGRRIFMATPDGRGRRAITLEPANAVAGGVAWSRDGNRIFFSA
jgi:Tol biopolymer transport system component